MYLYIINRVNENIPNSIMKAPYCWTHFKFTWVQNLWKLNMLNSRNSYPRYPRKLHSQNIHRINALSLGSKRKLVNNKLNNLFNLFVILVLITGCLLQIISIFNLYLSYPTNIFIETKFQSYSKTLPAISFCTNIGKYLTKQFKKIISKGQKKSINNMWTWKHWKL